MGKPKPNAPRLSAKKKRERRAKILGVITAVLAALLFIVREIVKDSVKETRDAITKAESDFQLEQRDSIHQIQLLGYQQKIEALKAGPRDPKKDYKIDAMAAQTEARIVLSQMDADFANLETFVKKLPQTPVLLDMLSKTRDQVKTTDKDVSDALDKSESDTFQRMLTAKLMMLLPAVTEIALAVVEDAVLTASKRWEDIYEARLKLCTWAGWFFGLLAAFLGLYAAWTGTRTEGAG